MAWEFVCFDIETDGLKPKHIHMISMTDLVTWESRSFVGLEEVAEAIDILDKAIMVVGHAINYFDCPVIEVMTESAVTFAKTKCVDTLEMSRHLMEAMRAHGLEAYGELLGLPKMTKPDFDAGFDDSWIPYCERDVELNCKVFLYLLEKLLEKYPEELPHKWQILREYLATVAA